MISHNKTNLYKRIAVSFLVVSLLIACSIFYLAFSWASITVIPRSENFTSTYAVEVSENSQGTDSVKGGVMETILDGQGTVSSTGTVQLSKNAEGTVTLMNTTSKDQPLRATTRILSANGTLFRTKEYVNVPAGGQVTAAVIADQEGEIGEISPRLIIPGIWLGNQDKIYAERYVPAQGGTSSAKLVSADDIKRAETKVVEKLKEIVFENLVKEESSLGVIDAIKVSNYSIQESTSDHKVGDKVENVTVKVKVKFNVVLFDDAAMRTQVIGRLKEKLAPGQDLIPPQPHEVRYDLGRFDGDKKVASIKVYVTAGKILKQDARVFDRERLVGLSKEEIKAYFSSNEDIQEVRVEFYPFWVVRSPLLSDHINVLIKK